MRLSGIDEADTITHRDSLAQADAFSADVAFARTVRVPEGNRIEDPMFVTMTLGVLVLLSLILSLVRDPRIACRAKPRNGQPVARH